MSRLTLLFATEGAAAKTHIAQDSRKPFFIFTAIFTISSKV